MLPGIHVIRRAVSLALMACVLVGLPAIAPRAVAAAYTATDLLKLGVRPGINHVFPTYLPPQSEGAGTVVGFGGGSATSSNDHALLWNNSSTPIDLNPSGFRASQARGISGNWQVGNGAGPITNYDTHALLWNGTAASAVDLNPAGYANSYGLGIGGNQQVGYGTFLTNVSNVHALLWTGTAASAVDLHPTLLGGFTISSANATDGNTQVGYAFGPSSPAHAILWKGTAASAVDLQPTIAGADASSANATFGGQQVGHYSSGVNNYQHAMLWSGTAASAIDLNPTLLPGFTYSDAYATNGSQQIGFGNGAGTGTYDHALLWSGTGASAIDLQALLPSSFQSSRALAFDAAGDIFGLAVDTQGATHAVEWSVASTSSAVPLPRATLSAAILLSLIVPWNRRAWKNSKPDGSNTSM